MQHRERRRAWMASVMVAGASAVTACQPTPPTGPTTSITSTTTVGTTVPSDPTLPTLTGYRLARITQDGTDGYTWSSDASSVTVTAPATNRDRNGRFALVADGAVVRSHQQACETWGGPLESVIQPGVVLRARVDGTRTTGILVTDNIFLHERRILNVHLIDTAAPQRLTHIGGGFVTSLTSADLVQPLPWRICGRVVDSTVTAKIWPAAEEEPDWNDPAATVTVTLPASAPTSGVPAGYIGHLAAGEQTTVTDLVAGSTKIGR